MKTAPAAVVAVVLCACSPGRPPKFYEGLAPSPLNGVWQASDAGRPLGVVIFELPDGPRWSPHGLVIESAQAYLTHDCRDFRVDPDSGVVVAATGIRPAGTLVQASPQSASLVWDLRPGLQAALESAYRSNGNLPQPTRDNGGAPAIDATVDRAGPNLSLRLEVTWGPQPADGGVALGSRDLQRLELTRVSRCP